MLIITHKSWHNHPFWPNFTSLTSFLSILLFIHPFQEHWFPKCSNVLVLEPQQGLWTWQLLHQELFPIIYTHARAHTHTHTHTHTQCPSHFIEFFTKKKVNQKNLLREDLLSYLSKMSTTPPPPIHMTHPRLVFLLNSYHNLPNIFYLFILFIICALQ